jgi:hypothetical protein
MAPCRHRVAGVADMLGTPDVPAYQEACLAARLSRLRVLGWPLALRLCTTDDGNEDVTLDELRIYMKETHLLREAHGQGIPWWSAEYGPERAPVVGARAPDGPLKSAGLSRSSTLLQVVRDAAARGPPESSTRWFSTPKARKGLVGVVFYSATCRVWNWGGVWTFPQLLNDYGVPIVFVYVSEYSVTDADALTDSRYVPVVDQPKEENWKAANCLLFGVPMVAAALGWRPDRVDQYIDGMDRALETAYEASPFRVYVLDAATATVAFRTGPGPLNGIRKARDLSAFLHANREF